MIISHALRFVYVGPPKTASTSMHDWLAQPALFDPKADVDTRETGEQHRHRIPAECGGYFTFATVRDEEDRLLSLWRMSRSEAQRGEDTPLMTLSEFRVWRRAAKPFYSLPLEAYMPEVLDARLRFEHLEEDALTLPFVAPLADVLQPLPRVNRNARNPKWAEAALVERYG